jgi:LacI family transcriptional regulator
MGAYDALRELGYSVPRDVAVRGFDDQEIIAAYLRPALSTSVLPHYEMGRWAVEFVLSQHARGDAGDGPPIQQTIHCPLVERDST